MNHRRMWILTGLLIAILPFLEELWGWQDSVFFALATLPIGLIVLIHGLFMKRKVDAVAVHDQKRLKRIILLGIGLTGIPFLFWELPIAPSLYTLTDILGPIVFFASFISIPLGIVLLIEGVVQYFLANRRAQS